MNPALQNLVVSLVAMQCEFSGLILFNLTYSVVARRIAFDDPVILNYVRIGYATAQVIILATYYWVSFTVRILPFQEYPLSHLSSD